MKVIFKKDEKENEIIAIFPEELYNERLYKDTLLNSYAHIGQHTSIHKDFLQELSDASKSEYQDLLNELISIGYDDLEILNESLITLNKLNEIVSEIDAEYQGNPFKIITGEHKGRFWIQVGTNRPDTYSGEMGFGTGGKVYVSSYATHDEVVKKIFGLVLAYVEHETREGFKWRGRRVFNPHVRIEALWSVAKKSNYRK